MIPCQEIASPCIRNCCLDTTDICLGCYRTLAEICAWRHLPAAEKQAVLARCALRQQAHKQAGLARDSELPVDKIYKQQ